jgi:hypothetical protein
LSYACLIMWKVSLWICLIFGRTWCFPIALTTTFSISAARRQLPFRTVTFFLNTPHARNCFLLGREQNGHGTISWLHVSAVMHNSANMPPVHEIIDCTTYYEAWSITLKEGNRSRYFRTKCWEYLVTCKR